MSATDDATATPLRLDWSDPDRVELSFPPDPVHWSLARLSASSIAATLDFALEEVEDLRLAIDELCTACSGGTAPEGRIALCFVASGDTISVECVVERIVGGTPVGPLDELPDGTTPDALAEMILAELVDDYEIGPIVGGRRRGFLEKRRQGATPS